MLTDPGWTVHLFYKWQDLSWKVPEDDLPRKWECGGWAQLVWLWCPCLWPLPPKLTAFSHVYHERCTHEVEQRSLPKASGGGLVAVSCPTLCDPMDFSPPGSSVPGILQARRLEWVAIFFSRGSSQPRGQTRLLHFRQILYRLSYQGNPQGWVPNSILCLVKLVGLMPSLLLIN